MSTSENKIAEQMESAVRNALARRNWALLIVVDEKGGATTHLATETHCGECVERSKAAMRWALIDALKELEGASK